jgi:hypothetical protein
MTCLCPEQICLKQVGLAKSHLRQHCTAGIYETLTRFACDCPKIREATSAGPVETKHMPRVQDRDEAQETKQATSAGDEAVVASLGETKQMQTTRVGHAIQTTLALLNIPRENYKQGIENRVVACSRSCLHQPRPLPCAEVVPGASMEVRPRILYDESTSNRRLARHTISNGWQGTPSATAGKAHLRSIMLR